MTSLIHFSSLILIGRALIKSVINKIDLRWCCFIWIGLAEPWAWGALHRAPGTVISQQTLSKHRRSGVMCGTGLWLLGWTSFHEATAMVGGQVSICPSFFKFIWTLFPLLHPSYLSKLQDCATGKNSHELSLKFGFNIHGFVANKLKQNHVLLNRLEPLPCQLARLVVHLEGCSQFLLLAWICKQKNWGHINLLIGWKNLDTAFVGMYK